MKTIIALMAVVLTLGLLSPSEAQAGHRGYYSGYHCHSGAAVVGGLIYAAAVSPYYAPSCGYYYGTPAYGSCYGGAAYGSYYGAPYGYTCGQVYYPRVSYGYYSSPRYCAPSVYYRNSYPVRGYYSSRNVYRGGYRYR